MYMRIRRHDHEREYCKNVERDIFKSGVEAAACRRTFGFYRVFYHKGEEKSGTGRYVKNQLLIGVTPGTDESVIENLAESYDADIVGYLKEMKMYQIEFRRDVSYIEMEKIAENLESCPYISYAMLNYLDDLENFWKKQKRRQEGTFLLVGA